MDKSVSQLIVDLELIRRLDKNGPRYTSYPTADRFVETFNAESYGKWVAKREMGGIERPLSLYVHIPFCNTLCFYCACNKVITKDRSKSSEYVRYLIKEMAMQAMLLGPDQVVEQLHFGGGTPKNFIQQSEVTATFMRQSASGHKYALQVVTDAPHWGGLSGCTFEEAQSWGKIAHDAHMVSVHCDSTIAMPILVTAISENQSLIRKRKKPRFEMGRKLEFSFPK